MGADLSGLELRCLAHYMNDKAYTNEILSGDIHTTNQLASGLRTRAEAKTFIYGFLYGGGDELIGKIVGGGKKEGRAVKQQFLDNTPALKILRVRVEKASERGYLKALDGRKIWVRSTHSALNFLLQSAGAMNAVGGFQDNGTPGVDGSFDDKDGNTITVSGGIITDLGV